MDILSKKYSIEINGISTQYFAQRYSNRIYLVISQCNSFGTLINVSKDEQDGLRAEVSDAAISTEFLLGVEENIYKVLAKKISSIIYKELELPILFSFALKEKSPETFQEILKHVDNVNVWES